ncbi:MAG TPA: cytochrome ubiquinol oxidase subunit I [Rhodanobacteraceae bacterium]
MFPGQWQLEIATSYCALLLPPIVGLPPLLAIMESVFVMTGREIWKQAARFWGELFAIALYLCTFGVLLLVAGYFLAGGAATAMALAVFGAMLAALFGEIVLYRRYFRDWWQRTRLQHLAATLLMALLPNLAILAIAAIGGWAAAVPAARGSDAAVHAADFGTILLDPVVQLRFVHLTSACYLTAAGVILSIGAWYLGQRRNVQIALRSMTIAASFGLAAALSLAMRGGTLGLEGSAHPLLMLWSFRAMVVMGMYLVALFGGAFYLASRRNLNHRAFLRLAEWSLPLPWFAMALGWVATEIRDGRWNPERISGITVAQAQLAALAFGFTVLVVIVVAAAQIAHVVRGGPERLKLWPADSGTRAGY